MHSPGVISYQNITAGREKYRAAAPVIISASRANDIPAYKSEWFFKQIEKGYVERINPFNGKKYYISLQNASAYVFWSKNPEPFLTKLKSLNHDFYFQFTLNNYENTGVELNVPHLQKRIDTYRALVDQYGTSRILWRFDPIIVTPQMPIDDVIARINHVAGQLKGYIDRLTISFLTLKGYRAAKERLSKAFKIKPEKINKFIPSKSDQDQILQFLSELQKEWKKSNSDFSIQACAMPDDYSTYGISPARCIDDQILRKLFPENQKLIEFLGGENTILKDDPYQRKNCHCIPSKDIGEYNTCGHECLYCYANKIK
jgi:hypothetical protein